MGIDVTDAAVAGAGALQTDVLLSARNSRL